MTRNELMPLCKTAVQLRYDLSPLQLGMDRHPYYVALSSILLCKTRRARAEPVLRELLRCWPVPSCLSMAEETDVQCVIRPCGLHRNRTRILQRFASRWLSNWTVFEDLPGCGVYVSDAVRLFCLGRTDLTCNDEVLHGYARTLAGQKEVRDAAS